ncbi:MAG: RNA polymerase sigma factor [Chloroflexota bacterium]
MPDAASFVPAISPEGSHAGERELVEAAQTEVAAFDALYQRYVTRIYRYIRLRVTHEQDALDLTQQVFVKALDALPRYRPAGIPFGAWLFSIARNAVTDHHRRYKTSIGWDLLPESLQPVSHADPEREVLRHESFEALHDALRTLDAYRRELLALRFASELTVREIAAILGKPEATVKSDIRRTLQRLKGQHDED